MNKHAPPRWLQLLSIVVSTQLSVTTCMHFKNPSEAKTQLSASLSAPDSPDLARSTHGDRSIPNGPESVIGQSVNMLQSTSVGPAKDYNFVNGHVHIDLTGVERNQKGISSSGSRPNDSKDHRSHPLFKSEQEDFDMFIKSCKIFENDFLPASSDAKDTGEGRSRTLVTNLINYNKEIAHMLTKKLTSEYEDKKFERNIQREYGVPAGEQEQFLLHHFIQVAQKKHALDGRVSQAKLDGIVRGLKECLNQIRFEDISKSEFRTSKAWQEEEAIVKMVFQPIEYMYRYDLITPHMMIKFFDIPTVQLVGRHLASVQIFEEGQDFAHFTPEIEEFRYDFRTYHVQKCLNDLPEDRKSEIVRSAIGTYWKAIESNPILRSLCMEDEMIKTLFTEDKDLIQIPLWGYAARHLTAKFERNYHSAQMVPETYKNKFNFYMLDFVLRYGLFKPQISVASKIDKNFLLRYFKFKMSYRNSHLLELSQKCLDNARKYRENMAENTLFTEEEWFEKFNIFWKTSAKIKKVMEAPSTDMLKNCRQLSVWLPSL